jgi:DNA-binding NarL/FixJ family response regulator
LPYFLWELTGFKALRVLYNDFMPNSSEPLASLQNVLTLLVEQARAYEHALPVDNYAARAAVTALLRLAQQAQSEAVSLADSFQPRTTSDHPFSPREHEVLSLAAQGLTNKEIAYRLGISERTVQFHINSIFNKTSTNSRTEAVALALRNGWITNESLVE